MELLNVIRMFDRTGPCPYAERCESYQAIRRAEGWVERELVGLRRRSALGDASSDEMDSAQMLEWRMDHMRRIKERCYSYNRRCLRFWQFRSEEEPESRPLRREEILGPDGRERELESEPLPTKTTSTMR